MALEQQLRACMDIPVSFQRFKYDLKQKKMRSGEICRQQEDDQAHGRRLGILG